MEEEHGRSGGWRGSRGGGRSDRQDSKSVMSIVNDL